LSFGQYIIIDWVNEEKTNQLNLAFQEGYNQGLTDAVSALFFQTDDCKATTITLGNLTRTIFDLDCVEQFLPNSP